MKKVPQKIVLVIASLGAGGAERVMTLLAGEWARRGKRVTLITLTPAETDHYTLPPEVRRIGLNAYRQSRGMIDALKNNMIRLKRLRQAITEQDPDVVISFMDATNVLSLLAAVGLRFPVIVSERIDPRYYPIAAGWDWLRRRLYSRAAAVVVQTDAVAAWAREFISAEKVFVIPNPVMVTQEDDAPAVTGALTGLSAEILNKQFIAAMGRLDRQKGFDILLQAYASLPLEYRKKYALVILGEGSEREALETQALKLSIADQVFIPGRMSNPFPVLSQATLFVLSSRFEGFPNALLEAMAAGLPVISFNCPSGPAEIITHDENGLLVKPEDPDVLSKTIETLLRDPDLRSRLASAAKQSVQRFSPGTVTDAWEQLIFPGAAGDQK